MPSFEQVVERRRAVRARLAHPAPRVEPGNARALVQRHGDSDVWLNPPPMPLTTEEMDAIYELPYQRVPHPLLRQREDPRLRDDPVLGRRSCAAASAAARFCSITEHEGRIIQNRSEDSILREIEKIRDTVPGFTGVISDLGGPTANMYRLACKSREIEAACRKPSCVFPGICPNLGHRPRAADQAVPARRARCPGIKKDLIASGVRYDLAVRIARVRQGARAAPRRRLPEDRARSTPRTARCRR